MSTLKATNIKNESSASNNIVLDSGGGVVVSGILTATTFSGNVSGNITIGAGSTSAPSLAPSGDSNTGVFFPSADTIAFAEGGAEAARIDSSGRLLVGTNSASGNNKLQVTTDILTNGNTVGRGAHPGNTNTALGYNVLTLNNDNNQNTAIGYQALEDNTSGTRNVAVGANALRDCTTSSNNVAIGNDALITHTAGAVSNTGNVAVGDQSGRAITNGYNNALMGYLSAYSMNTGYGNVCVGYAAGYSITTGILNTCVGNLAGDYTTSLTTGRWNVLIGNRPTPSSSGGDNQIVIATQPTSGQGKGDSTGFISPNGGGVYQGNNSSSWATTSDRRLKKNIVDNTEGLDVINQVRVVNFEYRLPEEIDDETLKSQALVNRNEDDEIVGLLGTKLGVIAQELQQVCPDCVKEESTGVLSVVDDNIFWHLVNAVKELSDKNQYLEAENAAILARLDAAGL